MHMALPSGLHIRALTRRKPVWLLQCGYITCPRDQINKHKLLLVTKQITEGGLQHAGQHQEQGGNKLHPLGYVCIFHNGMECQYVASLLSESQRE